MIFFIFNLFSKLFFYLGCSKKRFYKIDDTYNVKNAFFFAIILLKSIFHHIVLNYNDYKSFNFIINTIFCYFPQV